MKAFRLLGGLILIVMFIWTFTMVFSTPDNSTVQEYHESMSDFDYLDAE